jgi:SAM-dependent methyltransferase
LPSPSVRAHAGLTFANPFSASAVDEAVARLDPGRGGRVVETGCGSAEVLLRVLERHPGASGVGVDLDPDWVARARRAAADRLPGRDVRVVEAPAADAGLEPGSFDVVVNVASSHAHGGFPAALGALAALARPGGQVLLGEGFWTRPPSAEFLAALGGTEDELPDLDGLLAAAREAGLRPEHVGVASEEDWAAYEEGLADAAEADGAPDALEYARVIRERRALPDGGDTLGFALCVFRRGTTPSRAAG